MLRLCKGLSELGVNIHVLTIKQYMDIPNDLDLLSQIPKAVRVHRTPIIDPWRKYQAIKNRWKHVPGFRIFNKLISLLLKIISIPDHMIFWIPFAIREGNRIIKEFRIDSIVVSAPPNSSLWIGSVLKRKHKIPFVADLRDPVVDNLFEVSLIDPRDAISKIEKRLLKRMERSLVRKADAVVVTTSSYKTHLKEKYGRDTFYEVKNSFDKDDYTGVDREKYENFTISHTGSIIGLRRVDVLFRAIKRMVREARGETMGIRILLVGENDPRIREIVSTMGLEDYVKVEERVSHRKAIEIMEKSHLLLIVKETYDGRFLQIPAKFYEYMGSRNRILCLGPDSCEEAIIIKNLDLGHVVDDDEERLVKVMRSEYISYRSDLGIRHENPSDVRRYECREMARNYYAVLNNGSMAER
jgi:hypothetical protein